MDDEDVEAQRDELEAIRAIYEESIVVVSDTCFEIDVFVSSEVFLNSVPFLQFRVNTIRAEIKFRSIN